MSTKGVLGFVPTPRGHLGLRQGPSSPQVPEGVHCHRPHRRGQAVSGLHLEDPLPGTSRVVTSLPPRRPLADGDSGCTQALCGVPCPASPLFTRPLASREAGRSTRRRATTAPPRVPGHTLPCLSPRSRVHPELTPAPQAVPGCCETTHVCPWPCVGAKERSSPRSPVLPASTPPGHPAQLGHFPGTQGIDRCLGWGGLGTRDISVPQAPSVSGQLTLPMQMSL